MATPDAAAAGFRPDSKAENTTEELAALQDMAASLGYRLTPMSEGEKSEAPDPHPETVPGMVRRLAWLRAAASAASAQAKAYDAEYATLSDALALAMVEEEMSRTTVGGWTAYFAPTYKLRKTSEDVTTEDILTALTDSGQSGMIKEGYSYQSVQAWLKELHTDGLPVPEAMARVVQLDTGHEVRLRRSGSR